MHLRLALLPLLLTVALRSCSQPAPKQMASAEAFRTSVGVNLHLEYDGSPYADLVRTRAALDLLHVEHARDAAFRAGGGHLRIYSDLARTGLRFDLFFNRGIDDQIAHVRALLAAAPDAVSTVEGPNEIHNEAFEGRSPGSVAAAQAYQHRLAMALHADPALKSRPLLAFTSWPPVAAEAGAANFHSYPAPRQSPHKRLSWERRLSAATLPPGAPVYCTETGYTTAGADAVSEERQAILIPILLLENFRAGVTRTFLYELFDGIAATEAQRRSGELHFGLFTAQGAPKPAALAVARLMRLVDDRSAGSGAPRHVALRITGADLGRLDLMRRDGVRLTLLWPRDPVRRARPAVVRSGGAPIDIVELATGRRLRTSAERLELPLQTGVRVIVQEAASPAAS